MSLRVERSEWFIGDLEHYAEWYDRGAGWELAERYLCAVSATLLRLAQIPTLGHPTHFESPELSGMRCMNVGHPFEKHLIFYRHDETTLYEEETYAALAIEPDNVRYGWMRRA